MVVSIPPCLLFYWYLVSNEDHPSDGWTHCLHFISFWREILEGADFIFDFLFTAFCLANLLTIVIVRVDIPSSAALLALA